jgi:hypothetical protein
MKKLTAFLLLLQAGSLLPAASSLQRSALLGMRSVAAQGVKARPTVTRFYHNQSMRKLPLLQKQRLALIHEPSTAILQSMRPLQESLFVKPTPSQQERFYAPSMPYKNVRPRKQFMSVEAARKEQAALERSMLEMKMHTQIIADLEAKIAEAKQKNLDRRKQIAEIGNSLQRINEQIMHTGGEKGVAFMQHLKKPKIFSLQYLITTLEQTIEHEQHHIASLQATLDHQKRLKDEALQEPIKEVERIQQHFLKGGDILAVANDMQGAAYLKKQIATSSIKDRGLFAYHFITKPTIVDLAHNELGSAILQSLVTSSNKYGFDVREIRETIVIQALDDANIVAIASNQYGSAFLRKLLDGDIGRDKISELIADDVTAANIVQLADNEHGLDFLKHLWDTGNAYVHDKIGNFQKHAFLQTLQKPRATSAKSAFGTLKEYWHSFLWGQPSTSRVQH